MLKKLRLDAPGSLRYILAWGIEGNKIIQE